MLIKRAFLNALFLYPKEAEMEITQKKLSELIPYENNAKKHDETQIKNVAKSIKEYGFVQPIVIDKDNVIVIGHCRYEASKTLGIEEVPCVLVDSLTDEQVKALRLIDNKTNESPWDFDLLNEELEHIKDIDMSEFGFETIEELDFDSFFEDAEPKEKEPKKVQCPHCGEWFEA